MSNALENYMTLTEISKKLGLTRPAIIYRIKILKIKTERVGNVTLINKIDFPGIENF